MDSDVKVYIVEDMAFTRIGLEDKLSQKGYIVVGSSANAEEAWEELQKEEPDIVLLDINLAGEKDGIWLAKMIRGQLSMAIIFLTAFGDDKTLFEVEKTRPNGYLMKPYNTPTLFTTIKIALADHNKDRKLLKQVVENEDTVFIKEGSSKFKINLHDILYVQSDGNYLRIFTLNKKYLIRKKMDELEGELSSAFILRVHLRYLVNIEHIAHIDTNHIIINENEIPISKKYRKRINEILSGNY